MSRGIRLIPIIFGIIGIVFIVVCVLVTNNNNEFMKTAIETTGKITDVYVSRDSDGDTTRDVYVAFEVNGEEYSGHSSYSSSGMREGQDITIYYNPNNPNDFKVGGEVAFITIIFGILGGVFFLIGVIPVVFDIFKNKGDQKLIQDGTLVHANIDEIRINPNVSVNGFNPYVIECSYKDTSGGLYIFKSKNLYFNPSNLLDNQSTIDVYLDMEDPKKYFVDTRELEASVRN